MSYNDLRKGRYSQSGRLYFITAVTRQRVPCFSDFYCARLLVNQLREIHRQSQLDSLAWVVMPDHFHWLFQLGDQTSLSEVMRSVKARTAIAVNDHLHRQGALWQKSYYD
ncbi:MAG TPA: transposase, partial [Thiotrichales bacterium]|nr:transposase [Thiotrichales bacterium]